MLTLTAAVLLLGLACSLAPARAQAGSHVRATLEWASAPASAELTVPSGSPAVVRFQLHNTDANTPLVLLPWASPLDNQMPSPDAFSVAQHNGRPATYIGPIGMFVSQPAASHFVVVPPLGSVEVLTDVDQFFDVRAPGVYSVATTAVFRHASRAPYQKDQDVPDSSSFTPLTVDVVQSLTLVVQGVYSPHQVHEEQPYHGNGKDTINAKQSGAGPLFEIKGDCNHIMRQNISANVPLWYAAAEQAAGVISMVGAGSADAANLYKFWFDNDFFFNYDYVDRTQQVLVRIAQFMRQNPKMTFSCGDEAPICRTGSIAYTYGIRTAWMAICPFWMLYDNQFGTFQHEATHWNAMGGARDHGYGLQISRVMSWWLPFQAVDNSDNFMYFMLDAGDVEIPSDQCVPLINPTGAYANKCFNAKAGDECVMQCEPLHFTSGSNTRSCQQASGGGMEWSGEQLECRPDMSQCQAEYPNLLGDFYCDVNLNTPECHYDMGDCCEKTCPKCLGSYRCKDPAVLFPDMWTAPPLASPLPTSSHTSGCAAQDGFPRADAGETVFVPCGQDMSGVQTRVCSGESVWGAVDNSTCRDVWLRDLEDKRFTGPTLPQSGAVADSDVCKQMCQDSSLCAAWTFWSNKLWCGLFSKVLTGVAKQGVVSGYGAPKCAATRNRRFDMVDADNEFLSQSSVATPDACCDACATEPSCVAFHYKTHKQKCVLLSQAGGATMSTGKSATMGYLV